jgi:HK97 family phage prohead protease
MAVSDASWGQFTQADYSPEQWRRACLIDTGEGEPDSKARYKLPVREPDGTLNRNAAHAAASVLGGGRGGVDAPTDAKRTAARKLVGIYRNDLEEDPPESLMRLAGMSATGMTGRAEEMLPVRSCDRVYALDDLHIRADGSGRVVEAYAAAFDPATAEVMDQDGHYREKLTRSSFTKTIQDKGPSGFGVLFNHGRTVDGTPSSSFSMPIGVPLEVAADERGVFTATRYLNNPVADYALDAIRNKAVKAQSFSGRFMRSLKTYPDGQGRGRLPLITRHEVDMREYGPAVFAAYKEASILGTRAEEFVRMLLAAPPEKRLDFLQQFEGLTTPDVEPEALTVGTPAGAAELTEEPHEHSARSSLRSRIRAARIIRGLE